MIYIVVILRQFCYILQFWMKTWNSYWEILTSNRLHFMYVWVYIINNTNDYLFISFYDQFSLFNGKCSSVFFCPSPSSFDQIAVFFLSNEKVLLMIQILLLLSSSLKITSDILFVTTTVHTLKIIYLFSVNFLSLLRWELRWLLAILQTFLALKVRTYSDISVSYTYSSTHK